MIDMIRFALAAPFFAIGALCWSIFKWIATEQQMEDAIIALKEMEGD